MAVINHLKNKDSQRSILEVAFGRHSVSGDLCWSYATGAGASLRNFGYNALGEGEWDGVENVFYQGTELGASEYNFHSGALATAMLTGNQTVDPWFSLDVPHSRSSAISFRTPLGVGNTDTLKNPPTEFKGIFRTKKVGDYNNTGAQTAFNYSANPARCLAELFIGSGRIPNLPSVFADFVAYWKNRIDWGAWTAWRDYCNEAETVDYRVIADLQGFGLTASFFNGSNFETFISRRVDPTINYAASSNALSPGLNPLLFSARFEGFVKPKYTQTYTFSLFHDQGARLYIDNVLIVDGWATSGGTTTGTHPLTAGQFHNIRVEWFNTSGAANIELKWSSAAQSIEIVPSERLYPRTETRPRYESHIALKSATNFNDAMSDILFMSNSVKQDVNGKLRFFCLEQITPAFEFNSDNIIEGSFKFLNKNVLRVDAITEYEAQFLDLDSRYLEPPTTPVAYSVDSFSNIIRTRIVTMSNATRWQARKILAFRSRLEIMRGINCTFDAPVARAYPPMPGSIVTVNHRKIGTPKTFLVIDAINKPSGGKDVSNRAFNLQEWTAAEVPPTVSNNVVNGVNNVVNGANQVIHS